jgi:hypothetical protein
MGGDDISIISISLAWLVVVLIGMGGAYLRGVRRGTVEGRTTGFRDGSAIARGERNFGLAREEDLLLDGWKRTLRLRA